MGKKEVLELIESVLPQVFEAQKYGWVEYKKNHSEYEIAYEVRTRANIIRDLTILKIKELFHDREDCRIVDKNGLFLLSVKDKIYLRFKKFDDQFKTSNYPTSQSNAFEQGELFPLLTDTVMLNVGYITDHHWNSASFYIATPVESRLHLRVETGKMIEDSISHITTELSKETQGKSDSNEQKKHFTPKVIASEKKINNNEK